MALLFNRRAILQMGDVEVKDLRIAFRIEKSTEKEPTPAEISVWNLSPQTRAKFLRQSSTPVILQAGYVDTVAKIFSGDIARNGISTVRDGPDWVTTFRAGDGLKVYTEKRVRETFGPGTRFEDVVKRLTDQLAKNFKDAWSRAKSSASAASRKVGARSRLEVFTEFVNGTTLSGSVQSELDRLLKSVGLEWSIQDGEIQILAPGEFLPDAPVFLSTATGLIGSPEPGKPTRNGSGVEVTTTKFRSLLQPSIRPRLQARLETATVKGTYGVIKVSHVGDTHGQEWYSDCIAQVIS